MWRAVATPVARQTEMYDTPDWLQGKQKCMTHPIGSKANRNVWHTRLAPRQTEMYDTPDWLQGKQKCMTHPTGSNFQAKEPTVKNELLEV